MTLAIRAYFGARIRPFLVVIAVLFMRSGAGAIRGPRITYVIGYPSPLSSPFVQDLRRG